MFRGSSPGAGPDRRRRRSRRRIRLLTAIPVISSVLAGISLTGVPAASAGATETVIVTASGPLSAVTAVLQVGGSVLTTFHIIDGVEATILTALEPVLDALSGIAVSPNTQVSVQGTGDSTGPHPPADVFREETGADQLATAGDTGQGVTVAVLDTGISNLPDFAGRLAGGVDLTGAGKPYLDSYGHGTFVAGLIAGDGSSLGRQDQGEAPGARLVSVKVAGATGTTDLATLILGLQWADDHRDQYGIDVLNVSLGYRPTFSSVLDPLDQAVQAVWNHGITVAVSAGNSGPFNGTILSPGDDPLVVTVGALDDRGTPGPGDDKMNDFSAAGPTSPDGWAKPDLVTSGRSLVSLAVPGSTIYRQHPGSVVGTAGFAGSGTSFSAAIVSGAAALILAAHPGISPSEVKARLLGTAAPGPVGNPFVDGHGALDADAAATSGPLDLEQSAAGLLATLLNGTVSLVPDGPDDTWNTSLWTGLNTGQPPSGGPDWDGLNWNGADWNGGVWTGRAWNDGWWAGASWNSSAWTGRAWNDGAWAGSVWAGTAWAGVSWNSSAWS
jgi:serine protease AprX